MQNVFNITLDYRETSSVSTPSRLVYSGTQLFLSSKI
nr:MAG TPA: Fucosyltransferase, N-terminal [Microviridae sp.]